MLFKAHFFTFIFCRPLLRNDRCYNLCGSPHRKGSAVTRVSSRTHLWPVRQTWRNPQNSFRNVEAFQNINVQVVGCFERRTAWVWFDTSCAPCPAGLTAPWRLCCWRKEVKNSRKTNISQNTLRLFHKKGWKWQNWRQINEFSVDLRL